MTNPGGEWVKIGKDNLQGYIPAQCLAHINDAESDQEVIDLAEVQTKERFILDGRISQLPLIHILIMLYL